jgi:putative CocE/NonD family hydrolase
MYRSEIRRRAYSMAEAVVHRREDRLGSCSLIRTDFPRRVHEPDDVWIPLADGTRLAARIWLPEDADAQPVPALLEYIPYRKNDWTAIRDATLHAYFAGHGYGSVRVDIRGSGESDGILLDEYLAQEQDDGVEVVAWIARQPWCSGKVGMFGKSWGGFSALQVAARRPPALAAVISSCSTDDRYATDVHYMGGCLLAHRAVSWASSMLVFNARPPDPAVVGERWREMWLARLENTPVFAETWLSHQRRDEYWRHGSVCEDYDAIGCPVFMVGGWADGYRAAILRFLAGYSGPRLGLIGPWGHQYPQDGGPGPAIGFLQEAVRWWDHWLRGIDTGIMDGPMLRVWMQEAVEPRAAYAVRPGRWVAEPSWPSANVQTQERAVDFSEGQVTPSLRTGIEAGEWCGKLRDDLPTDQRADDAYSLVSTSPPLEERPRSQRRPAARACRRPPLRRRPGRRIDPHHAWAPQPHPSSRA